jgi:ATP-dependent exoDNAse (exonuclease V) beta subunit
MHRALERAVTAADVREALRRMAADALVSPAEHARLAGIIERALADPTVAGWFDGGWDIVRNENDILLPAGLRAQDGVRSGSPATRRPDRVMVRGTRAVVVDYKFGRLTPPAHATQLREYMNLLTGMGYTQVQGYLWYITLDKVLII